MEDSGAGRGLAGEALVRNTTCYMCACRCGIRVHLRDGRVAYIDGNRDHPVNRGVICGKGAAGVRQQYSPARLTTPLLRTGPRGSGEFRQVSWDEALEIASGWLGDARRTDPRKLAFFTGRDQSQALTGWWAGQFGTPNYAAHGGFCSVNMAAAGQYTFGGSFWEFSEPDWAHTRYFMMFGVAEDHASNPLKIGLGELKGRGVKVTAVNPVRTGYAAIADEWLGIRPGTDGLFIGALLHELLRTQRVDIDYLLRYTNAGWLVISDPGAADDGLFARDSDGTTLAGEPGGGVLPSNRPGIKPALHGRFRLADGREAVPVFELIARRYLADAWSPDTVAARTGIPGDVTRRIAAELANAAFDQSVELPVAWTDWTGQRHDSMIGRPVSMHAMRGIAAHANGFQTCRLLHLLQIFLGSIDAPGGFLYRPPCPKPVAPNQRPAGKPDEIRPGQPLPGPLLGYPQGPEDLLIDAAGRPQRIDKAYSWEAPLAAHGLLHMVISNAAAHDPYPVEVLLLYMANMAWNSAMNTAGTIEQLTAKNEDGSYRIPKIIYADTFNSEMVSYADLVLPDTTYLERWDCISLLDRPISQSHAAADAIRQPVVRPEHDVRPFQDVLLDLGVRLGLPGLVRRDGSARYPGGYADYMVNHERAPGIGPLAGWRGANGTEHGRGAANPGQLQRYIEAGCFWQHELPPGQSYFRHANRDYLDWARHMGFIENADPIVFQLYSETLQKFRLAAEGHGPVPTPGQWRQRIAQAFDPLPFWYPSASDDQAYPFHAITQRPMAMYHSWHSQNAWLRQIHGDNRLCIAREAAASIGLEDGDWAWISSPTGRIRARVRLVDGVQPDTVWTWNAIGKRAGAWGLDTDAPEAQLGFLLNHLIPEIHPDAGSQRLSNSDPVTGQAAWYDLKVSITRAEPGGRSEPVFEPISLTLPGSTS
ncbi:MAG: molybdopterin-dependent oxidoreductase [Chromatiales bacterium]|nr:molybdopterin-dependent oxidoreductase [Chromatiales bacterium]